MLKSLKILISKQKKKKSVSVYLLPINATSSLPYRLGPSGRDERSEAFFPALHECRTAKHMWPHVTITRHLHNKVVNFPDFRTMKLNAFCSSTPHPLNYVAPFIPPRMKVVLHYPSKIKK